MRNYHKPQQPQPHSTGDVVGSLSGDGSGVILVIQPGGAVMIPVRPEYQVDEFGATSDQYKARATKSAPHRVHKAGRP